MSAEKKEAGDFLSPLVRAAIAYAGAVVGWAAAIDVLSRIQYETEIREELEGMLGKDFVSACMEDEECRKTFYDMVEVSRYWDLYGPEVERRKREEERKKQREKARSILIEKLRELGIKLWCSSKDLGELGEFYEKCTIEFMGEEFDIEEIRWEL